MTSKKNGAGKSLLRMEEISGRQEARQKPEEGAAAAPRGQPMLRTRRL